MDQDEVEIFTPLAEEWWSEKSLLNGLRLMNQVRVPFILECLAKVQMIKTEDMNSGQALRGLNVLDIGCGGGFLSEDLARLGCEITAIDGISELIAIAKQHASLDSNNLQKLTYLAKCLDDFVKENTKQYDIVIASEVLDHVTDKEQFIRQAISCLRPGGSVFFSTMNKTLIAKIFCILLPEYVFNFIVRGVHDFSKFISLNDTKKFVKQNNCTTTNIIGVYYNWLRKYWFRMSCTSTWYILHAVKDQ